MSAPTFRFTSTGTYSQSRARSGAYYVSAGPRRLGMVRKGDTGWVAIRLAGGSRVSPPLPSRQAAAEWLNQSS